MSLLKNKTEMKILTKILISMAMVISVIASSFLPDIASAEKTNAPVNESPVVSTEQVSDIDYDSVMQTDELELMISTDNKSVAVKDRRTGYIWESNLNEERLTRKANELWSGYINSLFIFRYSRVDNLKGDIITGCSVKDVTGITRVPTEDGVRLDFKLGALKIEISIEFSIKDNKLNVLIPEERIVDGEINYLISLDLMPFFGASADTDEGFYLYPNGPGEIYRFKDIALRRNALKEYTIPYYSEHTVNVEQIWGNYNMNTDIKAMVPAYGVDIGSSSFVGIIDQGEAYAALHIVPGGVSVTVNRIFNTFVYRKSYGIFGSSIAIGGGSKVFPLAILIDKDKYPGDREMSYVFMDNEEFEYSAMANATKEHFVDKGRIPSGKLGGDTLPVFIDILGGIRQKRLFFYFFKKLTTFEQAGKIVKDLTSGGVDDLVISLKGWSRKGLLTAPYNYPASLRLGGKGGIKELAGICADSDVELLLDVNFIDIADRNGGYSLASDAARDPNNYLYSGNGRYLMAPDSVVKKINGLYKYLRSTGISGITHQRLGRLVYSDHSKKHTSLTADTIEKWMSVIKSSKEEFGSAAVSGGNIYAAADAAFLMDIPDKSVAVLFGDETVPFYQMIIHGSLYYTGTQINLFYDSVGQKLKMIEYGYIPYYELTYVSSKELNNTPYNVLFSSRYEDWRENIISLSKELNENLGSTYGDHMLVHRKITEGVYCVEYSLGTKVYVNYNKNTWTDGEITIEGENYLVTEKGAMK